MYSIANEWKCGCNKSQPGRGETSITREAVAKIITIPEPCLTVLLEKLREFFFTDQPWLLQKRGETARISHVHCSIVLSVDSTHLCT